MLEYQDITICQYFESYLIPVLGTWVKKYHRISTTKIKLLQYILEKIIFLNLNKENIKLSYDASRMGRLFKTFDIAWGKRLLDPGFINVEGCYSITLIQ